MTDNPKPREFSLDEIRSRREKREYKSKKEPPRPIVRRRNRARTRYRHCVSLSPQTALFFRIHYGGEEMSLSRGIERAGKVLFQMFLEEHAEESMIAGIERMSKEKAARIKRRAEKYATNRNKEKGA